MTAGATVAGVGATLFFTAPDHLSRGIWDTTVTLLLMTMAFGIWRHQVGRRRAWLAIWAGLFSAHVGGLLISHAQTFGIDPTAPSVADLLRLGNYPLAALGVLVLLARADRRVGWRASLEAALAVGAGAVVIWVVVIGPLVATSTATGLGLVVTAMYPLMDILLLGVLIVLVMHLDSRPGPLLLVGVAIAGNLLADIAFGAQSLTASYSPGSAVDGGWLLCFAGFAIAPSWPLEHSPAVVGDNGRLGLGRSLFLGASATIVPSIAVARSLDGAGTDIVVAVGGLVLLSLALLRMRVFNIDLEKSRTELSIVADQLASSNRALAEARADQRRLFHRMHQLVEQERIRLAADIHDRPIQSLAGVGYQVERLRLLAQRGDMVGTADLADGVADALATQLGELRRLMTEIRPPVLDEQGLVGALRDSAARVEASSDRLQVLVEGDHVRLDPDTETTLYRVAQEALQNVVRHANASVAVITFAIDDDLARLVLSDDGDGFDPDQLPQMIRSGHFGLAGMRERIELLDGTLDIKSSAAGTCLEFRVPLTQRDDPAGKSQKVLQAVR